MSVHTYLSEVMRGEDPLIRTTNQVADNKDSVPQHGTSIQDDEIPREGRVETGSHKTTLYMHLRKGTF